MELKEGCPNTEFSKQFLQGMLDRMAMSFYVYGKVADAYPEKVNAVASIQVRLREYARTGNTEFLIDAANFAMIEFMHPAHPDAHFTPTDNDQSPGRVNAGSGMRDKRNNEEI